MLPPDPTPKAASGAVSITGERGAAGDGRQGEKAGAWEHPSAETVHPELRAQEQQGQGWAWGWHLLGLGLWRAGSWGPGAGVGGGAAPAGLVVVRTASSRSSIHLRLRGKMAGVRVVWAHPPGPWWQARSPLTAPMVAPVRPRPRSGHAAGGALCGYVTLVAQVTADDLEAGKPPNSPPPAPVPGPLRWPFSGDTGWVDHRGGDKGPERKHLRRTCEREGERSGRGPSRCGVWPLCPTPAPAAAQSAPPPTAPQSPILAAAHPWPPWSQGGSRYT